MAILIKKNGNLVSVGESSKVEVETDKLANRIAQTDFYSYQNNEITSIISSAFVLDMKLTSISCQNVTSIGGGAFQQCQYLTSISFPSCTSLEGNSVFSNCKSLTSVNLNSLSDIDPSTFDGCIALENIELPNALRLQYWAFYGCSALKSITLSYNGQYGICVLGNTNAIPASSTHHITIYVPSNLVNTYKTSTNWVTLYNNGYIDIVAIS